MMSVLSGFVQTMMI